MPAVKSQLEHRFRALRHRNFRLFLGGQIISISGAWMQQLALSWLVYRLTQSPFLLGLVGFAGQFPALFLAPLGGVWADRWNRHRMVIATQVLAMLQALALAALVLTDLVAIWHILALSVFLGLVTGVDIPARQSFLVEMVEGKEDLANAIALNSSTFNAARLLGPSVAGILIGLIGEGMVFLINGLSYLAVILGLLAMRVTPRAPRTTAAPRVWPNLKEGVLYAVGFVPIRAILLLVGLVSLMGIPFTVLLPVFATEILQGGPRTLGFLVGANGLGALAGALYLAGRRSVRGLGRAIPLSVVVFGCSLIAFALARSVWLSMTLLFVSGFGMMVQLASSNTILQTIVDDDKRGRVMSLYSMSFMGAMPLGSLLAGVMASRIGAPATVVIGAVACVLSAAWFARALPVVREQVRPIYERLGILPEVAAGIATATEPGVPRPR